MKGNFKSQHGKVARVTFTQCAVQLGKETKNFTFRNLRRIGKQEVVPVAGTSKGSSSSSGTDSGAPAKKPKLSLEELFGKKPDETD